MNKFALGRGLGSLIPSAIQKPTFTEQVIPEAHRAVLDVPVEKIRENPHQPRQFFSPSDLEDLILSIKEHGILQPLIVTKTPAGYELIAGERRLRAAKVLGLATVPAIVREATEQQKLELALIENIQREDLNAVEEAIAYRALIEEFNLKQDDVARRVGKNRSTISNILRLLDLSEDVLIAIRDNRISKSHARTLLAEPNEEKRRALFHAMLEGGVSVREAEARVPRKQYGRGASVKQKDPNIAAHEARLREILGTKVDIQESAGKGKVVISFYSKEELLGILDRLIGD